MAKFAVGDRVSYLNYGTGVIREVYDNEDPELVGYLVDWKGYRVEEIWEIQLDEVRSVR